MCDKEEAIKKMDLRREADEFKNLFYGKTITLQETGSGCPVFKETGKILNLPMCRRALIMILEGGDIRVER